MRLFCWFIRHCLFCCSSLLLLGGSSCSSSTLDQMQRDNIRLIKQLQQALNQRQWSALARFYAGQVRYKGPSTNHQEVMQTPTQVVSTYAGGPLEIIQLYPSYQHQVVVEGRVGGHWQPRCLIYTIEQGRITRQYAY